ncbi:MAG: hypothetical protein IJY46_07635 [Lentisphaeria bacterium]|nr:hypothetical protein [Lentisphaeria bacterium]
MSIKIHPGTYNSHHVRVRKEKKNGQIPLLALLVIFGAISLFSIMAFFLAILALAK